MQALRFLNKLFEPVRIHTLYATRPYYLGDTVEMAVQVVTRDRIEIIRGTAELLWDAKGAGAASVRAEHGKGPYVHSANHFCRRRMLRPGAEENFSVDLRLEPEPPMVGIEDAKWTMRVEIELIDRRIFTLDNKILIAG